jgi:hypothetical protein
MCIRVRNKPVAVNAVEQHAKYVLNNKRLIGWVQNLGQSCRDGMASSFVFCYEKLITSKIIRAFTLTKGPIA